MTDEELAKLANLNSSAAMDVLQAAIAKAEELAPMIMFHIGDDVEITTDDPVVGERIWKKARIVANINGLPLMSSKGKAYYSVKLAGDDRRTFYGWDENHIRAVQRPKLRNAIIWYLGPAIVNMALWIGIGLFIRGYFRGGH